MREKILELVLAAVAEINEELDEKIAVEQGETAALFGKDGVVDSMSLVSLIVAIEQAVEDEFDVSVILADEKAMSQHQSPFKTIGSLVNYTTALVQSEAA